MDHMDFGKDWMIFTEFIQLSTEKRRYKKDAHCDKEMMKIDTITKRINRPVYLKTMSNQVYLLFQDILKKLMNGFLDEEMDETDEK